jgi:hypothetical protein
MPVFAGRAQLTDRPMAHGQALRPCTKGPNAGQQQSLPRSASALNRTAALQSSPHIIPFPTRRLHPSRPTSAVISLTDSPSAHHTHVVVDNAFIGHSFFLRILALLQQEPSERDEDEERTGPQRMQHAEHPGQHHASLQRAQHAQRDAGSATSEPPPPAPLPMQQQQQQQQPLTPAGQAVGAPAEEVDAGCSVSSNGTLLGGGAAAAASGASTPRCMGGAEDDAPDDSPPLSLPSSPSPSCLGTAGNGGDICSTSLHGTQPRSGASDGGQSKLRTTTVELKDSRAVWRYSDLPALPGVSPTLHEFLAMREDVVALDVPRLLLRLPFEAPPPGAAVGQGRGSCERRGEEDEGKGGGEADSDGDEDGDDEGEPGVPPQRAQPGAHVLVSCSGLRLLAGVPSWGSRRAALPLLSIPLAELSVSGPAMHAAAAREGPVPPKAPAAAPSYTLTLSSLDVGIHPSQIAVLPALFHGFHHEMEQLTRSLSMTDHGVGASPPEPEPGPEPGPEPEPEP